MHHRVKFRVLQRLLVQKNESEYGRLGREGAVINTLTDGPIKLMVNLNQVLRRPAEQYFNEKITRTSH